MIDDWLLAIFAAPAGVAVVAAWIHDMFFSLDSTPSDKSFNRNQGVLTMPSLGIALTLLAPISVLRSGSTVQTLLYVPFLLFTLLGLIGLLPIPLPRWVYPEWRAARRKQVRNWINEAYDPASTILAPYPDPADIPWPPPHWRREHRKARRARRPQEEKDQALTEGVDWTISMAVGIPGTMAAIVLGYIVGLLLEVLLGWEDTSLPVIAGVITCVPGSLISVAAGRRLGRRLAHALITARNRLRDQPPRP